MITGLLAAAVVLSGCGESDSKLNRFQGMAYSPDATTLYLATDNGILRYSDETGWVQPETRQSISGFAAMQNALYVGSDGLKKSTDGGRTFQDLGASGVHFDFLAASLHGHAIYAWVNTDQPPLEKGLNYTQDEGKTWTHAATIGLENEKILCLTVHPDDDRYVGVGTERGMSLSDDRGEHFNIGYPDRQMEQMPVTALTFDAYTSSIPVLAAPYQGKPQVIIGPFDPKLYISSMKGTPEFWNQPMKPLYQLSTGDEAVQLLSTKSSPYDYTIATKQGDLIRLSLKSSAFPQKLIDHGTLRNGKN
ncbi:hypothetical protein EL26_18725 [Tumebacillus flagellatus]|uniref:Sortilin N-terminal domain-containing protein n=2 Tax=Tumebacillus flagellatus TaxID=1157490 RepID=A0A074LPT6_9BACL|nr:hypothetical protein EL26_18725 [Tumebacillus flagellatus]